MKCDHDSKVGRIIAMVLGGVALAVAVAFLLGFFVMLLWNWLMPEIFGLREITYWQAWGLVLLGRFLFGGHGQHAKQVHKHGDKLHGKIGRWIHNQPESDATP